MKKRTQSEFEATKATTTATQQTNMAGSKRKQYFYLRDEEQDCISRDSGPPIVSLSNDERGALLQCEANESAARFIKRLRKDTALMFPERTKLLGLSNSRGDYYARQAHRMTTDHFWRLYELLKPHMRPEPLPLLKHREDWNQPLRIKVALRFFAGGDPLEIAIDHCIPTLRLLEQYIFDVIAAVHDCEALKLEFPESHDEQREIATGFELFKSDAGIDDCCGALGGMLLQTDPPPIDDATLCAKYFHKQRGLWGLNMQAICDYNGRFMEVCLKSPASTSDSMAFCKSSFRRKLERQGFLADGLSLYADEQYPDSPVITKPIHLARADKTQDYRHFQLRDQVDVAFSCLLQRWALLRRPLPLSLGKDKISQLVLAACKLQNFCLDDSELMPPLLAGDVVFGILNGAVLLDQDFRPARLLGAGVRVEEKNCGDAELTA